MDETSDRIIEKTMLNETQLSDPLEKGLLFYVIPSSTP
ncbi:hypothetical protein HNR31_001919 [Anoxybacillus caldiproteolyticus]|uniref:Uncharacterized protein n=1 Tax=Thermaerobacillus caldiproteolyticus TaxID=247480 RepID=A0A7V9Z6Y0_9BACL|nr:hypothetical protein [Anoxybacillus caldiproteolyticus]